MQQGTVGLPGTRLPMRNRHSQPLSRASMSWQLYMQKCKLCMLHRGKVGLQASLRLPPLNAVRGKVFSQNGSGGTWFKGCSLCVAYTMMFYFGRFLPRCYQSALGHAVICNFGLRKTGQTNGFWCFVSNAGIGQSHAAVALVQSRVFFFFQGYLGDTCRGGVGRADRACMQAARCASAVLEMFSRLWFSVQHCKVQHSKLASGCAELCVA